MKYFRTGDYEMPKEGEWFESCRGEPIKAHADYANGKYWILRAVDDVTRDYVFEAVQKERDKLKKELDVSQQIRKDHLKARQSIFDQLQAVINERDLLRTDRDKWKETAEELEKQRDGYYDEAKKALKEAKKLRALCGEATKWATMPGELLYKLEQAAKGETT